MKVRVSGFRELEASLSELPKATGKNVLRRVLKAAGEPIRSAAEENAPVLTGQLEASIVTATRLTRRQARLAKRANKSTVEMHVGTKNQAAVPQEFGTIAQAAQPFMRPAWDGNKDQALEIIKSDLGSEIEKAAARLAKRRMRVGR
jgi:HK97 gp10 family phage protein